MELGIGLGMFMIMRLDMEMGMWLGIALLMELGMSSPIFSLMLSLRRNPRSNSMQSLVP